MLSKFHLKLVVSGRVYTFEKSSLLIGRSPQCDICVDSGLISRHHASVLAMDTDTLILKDLDSAHGTFINTMRIAKPTPLQHGDVITIGDEKMIVMDTERQPENHPSEHYLPHTQAVREHDGFSGRRLVESSFFRTVNLSPAHYALDNMGRVPCIQQALGERQLDASRTPGVLLVQSGAKRGALIELKLPVGVEREWRLGCSQLCDVVLEDPTVSHCHAIIRWEKEAWNIQDNQSTNGVRVNGQKMPQAPLRTGDIILIGSIQLLFRAL